jgi:hypothetical protein
MKKSLVIFLALITGTQGLRSQRVSSVTGSFFDHFYGVISLRNTSLFDAAEIKTRAIKRCYIIHPRVNWKKETYRTDTLFIYDFDPAGNILRQVRFTGWEPSQTDTT